MLSFSIVRPQQAVSTRYPGFVPNVLLLQCPVIILIFLFFLLLILEKTDEVRNLRETRVLTEGEKKVWENIP